ncbi:hypothetical protein BES34_016380 [Leptospira inadai serovar Lyme]|uniref:Lipoprotein n=1 Tax=Leptospira inadai serovar Lyme TaxID=293084 RepID=A0ABX4YF28_9LEPT|nr:hypothetical protein BES34_016380 [Leptospira inadai serovar Lyme]
MNVSCGTPENENNSEHSCSSKFGIGGSFSGPPKLFDSLNHNNSTRGFRNALIFIILKSYFS